MAAPAFTTTLCMAFFHTLLLLSCQAIQPAQLQPHCLAHPFRYIAFPENPPHMWTHHPYVQTHKSFCLMLDSSPVIICCFVAEVVQVPQAPAPTAAPSTVSNSTMLHSSVANISTDTSCSVSLQEETLLCEALPGYLADMSHCIAPPQASTWHLAG